MSPIGCAIIPSWNSVTSCSDTPISRLAILLSIFSRHMLYRIYNMEVRLSIIPLVASSSRVLIELVSFGTLRCSSRTTLRNSSVCLACYVQLGSHVFILHGQNCYELPYLLYTFSKSIIDVHVFR